MILVFNISTNSPFISQNKNNNIVSLVNGFSTLIIPSSYANTIDLSFSLVHNIHPMITRVKAFFKPYIFPTYISYNLTKLYIIKDALANFAWFNAM